MIREIFITSSANKVLFGDTTLFPDAPGYPVHVMDDGRLCQLRINDVVLSILYRNMDSFTAAKYLHDLKNHIEDRVAKLNEKNVYSNYFAILELLQGRDIIYDWDAKASLNLQLSDNTYIDVVESVHATVLGDGTVLENNIHGTVLLSRRCAGSLRMILNKGSRCRITAKSNYELINDMNKLEVSGKDISAASALLSYSTTNAKAVLFSMRRVDASYTFECPEKLKFKFIRFLIPVPATTFAVKTQTTRGYARFDMEENLVAWDIEEGVFASESISIERHALEEYVDARPVRAHFAIPDWSGTGLRVESCGNENNPSDKFWVTYTTQDGYYEIRE